MKDRKIEVLIERAEAVRQVLSGFGLRAETRRKLTRSFDNLQKEIYSRQDRNGD